MATPDAAAKTAPKPLSTPAPKRPSPGDDEDEDGKGAGPAAKPKFLPTGLSRSIVVAAVLLTAAVLTGNLFADRYELVPAPNSANGFMYRIDTLTGTVHFCGPPQCTNVPVRAAGGNE